MSENRKRFYFYVVVSERYAEGRMCAYVDRVADNENVCTRYNGGGDEYPKPLFGQLCPTKKAAEEIAEAWNADYKKRGVHAFQTETAETPEN